jgi:hypothetical protein
MKKMQQVQILLYIMLLAPVIGFQNQFGSGCSPHFSRHKKPADIVVGFSYSTTTSNLRASDSDDYEQDESSSFTSTGKRRPIRRRASAEKVDTQRAVKLARHAEALQDPHLLTKITFAERTDIHPATKRAIQEVLGLQSMTEIQARTYAAALDGQSILGRARTGTGGFNAFLIAIIVKQVPC